MIQILDSPPHVGAYRFSSQLADEDYDGRFARAAIVTYKRWLVAATGFAAHLLPHTEVRTFAQEEHVLALAWAGELDPHAPSS